MYYIYIYIYMTRPFVALPHLSSKTQNLVHAKHKPTKRQESTKLIDPPHPNHSSPSLSHFVKHIVHSFTHSKIEGKSEKWRKGRWECWRYYMWWCWCWFYVCLHHHRHCHQLHILTRSRIGGSLWYQRKGRRHWSWTELAPPLCSLLMGTSILLGTFFYY